MATKRKRIRAALYARVSTDQQTTANQVRELRAAAERHGWDVVLEELDEGISGGRGRELRPGLDRVMRAVTRRDVDLVAAWSVDRLGRSLQDLVGLLGDVHAAGVEIYLHQQGLDTTTPSGRAMFGMLGVFAEFERALIQERVRAGLARARAQGKRLGRPPLAPAKVARVRALLEQGSGIRAAARGARVGLGTAQRIAAELAAEA